MLTTILAMFLACTTLYSQDSSTSRSTRTLTGIVYDSLTNQPLHLATIRYPAGKRVAATTRQGEFAIQVGADTATLSVRFVGYRIATIRVPTDSTRISVGLVAENRSTEMVVVTAEDPALRIMRKVLERKAKQLEQKLQYTYNLYTKFVATTDTSTALRSSGRGDTTVFSILESYSKGYAKPPSKFFNEILYRKQTANIPAQANVVAFGTNLNAFDDAVTILNEEITTPFFQGALDAYSFELLSPQSESIVNIRATAKGGRKAFDAVLTIDQTTYTPMKIVASINSNVNLPFGASFVYSQTFVDVNGFILPEALSIYTSAQADILFLFSPRLDISIETFCDNYEINAVMDEDVFERKRVEIVDGADTLSELEWRTFQKLPLRAEERKAYAEIQYLQDNPDSLQSSFFDSFLGPVTRTIARLGRKPFTGFDDVFRYTSVTGALFGIGLRFRPDTSIELNSTVGYGIADSRGYCSMHVQWFADELQKWSVSVGGGRYLVRRDDPWILRQGLTTITTLLSGFDPADYYYSDRLFSRVRYSWGQQKFLRSDVFDRVNNFSIGIIMEDQQSARSRDVFHVFPSNVSRKNPAVFPGITRAIAAELNLEYSPVRVVSRNGLSVAAELSSPHILPTDFEYALVSTKALLRFRTLPLWTLDVALQAVSSWGALPPQRWSSIEAAIAGIALPGTLRGLTTKEYYGDHLAVLSLSHNFGELIPGLLRIPNVASFGIEFILQGALAYSSFRQETHNRFNVSVQSTAESPEGWYYEAGLAINRILLFFRADVNARFSQRQEPQFRFTLSAATF
jgi:hypothetical protein